MSQAKVTMNPNGKTQTTLFIPAFLEDNPILIARDPEYEQRLMRRDQMLARALRYGDWSVFAGQMFPEFSKVLHVIRPIELGEDWMRWVSIDWGYAAPWSVHWWAENPRSKRVYVYRELYRVGLTDPEQAEMIKQHTLPGERISFYFADPSMWNKDSRQIIVKSSADIYQDNGIYLTKANNNHMWKISQTHSALALIYDELPAVQIFDTCEALVRTLPLMMRDPKNVEDIQDGLEDHAFDDFTYGLTNWLPPVVQRQEPKKPRNSEASSSPMFTMKGL